MDISKNVGVGMKQTSALGACIIFALSGITSADVELVGFASLPADTFAEGPPAGGEDGTGNPISANGRTGPFPGQPVQGFSGVQFGTQRDGSFWFLSDNGFGNKENSTDYLLRIYQLRPDFRTAEGGDASVMVEDFIQFADPDGRIPFPIVNEATAERLLTGSDFDIESFVIDQTGDIWVGDEFGPFILHFDANGTLLDAPISAPDINAMGDLDNTSQVRSPDNPFLAASDDANIGRSGGFEGMAFTPSGYRLYPLLEKSVETDPADALRIYDFQAESAGFARFAGFYQKAVSNHAIGDFAPINNNEYLVIERDGRQGAAAHFKKIFKIDITRIDQDGYVDKEEVVDLLNIDDPDDLNDDGNTTFDFPFVTIENVLVLSEDTILVANDNNYPFSSGRDPDIDNNEIIILRLDPLDADNDNDGIIDTVDSDDDNDGLPDLSETNTGAFVSSSDTGTDPLMADTDGDGLKDGDEVNQHNLNPTLRDSDGDGFGDGVEISAGTNPNSDTGPWPAGDGDLAVPYDGVVNAVDVLVAKQMVLGLRIQETLALAHGDLALSGASAGVIDVADLILIIQKALGEP